MQRKEVIIFFFVQNDLWQTRLTDSMCSLIILSTKESNIRFKLKPI